MGKAVQELTNEMSPDVASLGVDAEDGTKALGERVELWTMAVQQEVIITQPSR